MSEEDSSSSIGDNGRVDVVLDESGGTGSPSADVFDASQVRVDEVRRETASVRSREFSRMKTKHHVVVAPR